ncbi:hypothetical protein [Mangrovihabitans endophyticus]|uniref:Uncharacterized protein n=1 Tax=Mangrovihabitans endophyticus TaxID=1751298 RepID=A0A8J3C269_9ACTN|nr:hypothetical protein [Mangrovihabitans endophyticus]GGK97707.1 hypothetical protein GCM10012284_34950 [Mangrovihabitans endophyticus]
MTAPAKDPMTNRREKAASTGQAAEKARESVADLDSRLRMNASQTKEQKQALRNALAEADRLKAALKAGERERENLSKRRKKAASKAEKARAKAKSAEQRYDKMVLAEMVRREKERESGSAADPEPERPNQATSTATSTAARKTAADAGNSEPQNRPTPAG